MSPFEIGALVLASAYLYLNFKDRRKVDATVHIQAQTEEAESMNFGVTLFKDESAAERDSKLRRFFEISEARRAFNNKRLLEEHQARIEAIAKERATKKES